MYDNLDLGCTPANETCIPAGTNPAAEREECKRYITRIKEHCGEPPHGARFRVRSNSHEFGVYWSVQIVFDTADRTATNYAYWVEAHSPMYWDNSKEPAQLFVEQPEPVYTDQYGTVITPDNWYRLPAYAHYVSPDLLKKLMGTDWLECHGQLFAPIQCITAQELTEWNWKMGETLKDALSWYDEPNHNIERVHAVLTRVDPDAGIFYHA